MKKKIIEQRLASIPYLGSYSVCSLKDYIKRVNNHITKLTNIINKHKVPADEIRVKWDEMYWKRLETDAEFKKRVKQADEIKKQNALNVIKKQVSEYEKYLQQGKGTCN